MTKLSNRIWPLVGLALTLAGLSWPALPTVAQSTSTTAYIFTNFAGGGASGSVDGAGTNAQFNLPRSVALDSTGNVYVADSGNNTIRIITPLGVVSTLAGTAGYFGSVDGTNSSARFSNPSGVAVDSAGNTYVADLQNCTIRKVTPDGVVTTLAGRAQSIGSADGTGTNALFNGPSSVAVDSAGNVYVTDTYNHTIRKITAGGVVTTLAGQAGHQGLADGAGTNALFDLPLGVAVDSTGNVYVADTANSALRKVTPAGVVATLAGSTDGTGTNALFNSPCGVAVDSAGNVYVADTYNSTIREVTAQGVVTTLAGQALDPGSVDGTGTNALFNTPRGVALDIAGNVYVADTGNNSIRQGIFYHYFHHGLALTGVSYESLAAGGVNIFSHAPGGLTNTAYLVVNLGPVAAVSAGAGFSLSGSPYSTGITNFTDLFSTTTNLPATLVFAQIPGWDTPVTALFNLVPGEIATVSADYGQMHPPAVLNGARLVGDGQMAMTLLGYTGSVYSIVASTNLLTPRSNWNEVFRLTNSAGQVTFTNPLPPPPPPSQDYYSAKEL